jgi:uncharacterized protein (TIGR02284 family)
MEKIELLEMLKELIQVNVDMVHTYNRALNEISDPVVRSRSTAFRDNHQKHIEELSDAVRSLGGQAPEPTKDFKGYVIEAFTALGTMAGMKGTLKALMAAEALSNRHYEKVVPKSVPPDLKETIRKHFSDEKNHSEYIRNNLRAL